MPRYHFHINDEADSEGYELANVDVAQREALGMAGKIISDTNSGTFWNAGHWTMTVSTPDGLTLFDLVIVGSEAPAIRERAHLAV